MDGVVGVESDAAANGYHRSPPAGPDRAARADTGFVAKIVGCKPWTSAAECAIIMRDNLTAVQRFGTFVEKRRRMSAFRYVRPKAVRSSILSSECRCQPAISSSFRSLQLPAFVPQPRRDGRIFSSP